MEPVSHTDRTMPIIMKGEISPPRFLLYSHLVLLLVFVVYLPITDFYFTSDDYFHIAFASENGLSVKSLFVPIADVDHLQPVLKLIMAIEYRLFGDDPGPYYEINLLVHLANTALVIVVFSRLLSSRVLGLLGGLLFGVSASIWRVPMWITTQVWMLGTTFFLLSTLFFILYIRNGRRWHLALSAVSHLLMLLSFSWGVQAPVMFFALYCVMRRGGGKAGELRRGVLAVTPLIVNVALYFLLREVVTTRSVIDSAGGVGGAVANLPKAFLFMFGGIYKGFVISFTGAYSFAPPVRWIVAIAVILAAVLLTDWSAGRIRARLPLMCCLALWVFLLYFPPTLPRIPWGFEWFVSRSRYRYITCIPAAAIAVVCFMSLRCFSSCGRSTIYRALAILFFGYVVCANIYEIRRREDFVYGSCHEFQRIESVFLGELELLMRNRSDEMIRIVNEPFSAGKSVFAGWNARPELVCTIHLPSATVERIEFVSVEGESGSSSSRNIYFVEKGTGNLKPLARP